MKRICWITLDCFFDVDWPIVSRLGDRFYVDWFIVRKCGGRYSDEFFNKLPVPPEVNVSTVKINYRDRDPRTLINYLELSRIIRKRHYDCYYFNVPPTSPYIIPLFWSFPKKRSIFTAHDGYVTPLFKFPLICKAVFELCYGCHAEFIHMFSNSQANLFTRHFNGKTITVIPLSSKDYGVPTMVKRNDCISFLFFGIIHPDKNIELLIEAVNQLVDEGVTNIKLSINGVWECREDIQTLIRHQEYFELNLSMIPNEAVPDLFAYNHFAVFPYRRMSQSGALKCAFQYRVPVIVSDLEGFTEEVVAGTDGFVFEEGNIDSLKQVLRHCISLSPNEYGELVNRMNLHVGETYDIEALTDRYSNMFDNL